MSNLLRNLMMLTIVFLAAFSFSSIQAAPVATFAFTTDKTSVIDSSVIANATQSDGVLLDGVGPLAIIDDGFGNVLGAYPTIAGSTDAANALANNSFFTITINSLPGQPIDINTIQFDVGKGGGADPRGYFIRTSADNYNSDLISISPLPPAGASTAPATETIDVSGNTSFDGITSLTIRIYVFTPNPTANSVDFRNFIIDATATPATATQNIPVFGPFGLLAALLGLLWFGNRRRNG